MGLTPRGEHPFRDAVLDLAHHRILNTARRQEGEAVEGKVSEERGRKQKERGTVAGGANLEPVWSQA